MLLVWTSIGARSSATGYLPSSAPEVCRSSPTFNVSGLLV
jgi:hypothetical protein